MASNSPSIRMFYATRHTHRISPRCLSEGSRKVSVRHVSWYVDSMRASRVFMIRR